MENPGSLIIGVSGLAGSGKSTVAEMLADCRFVTISLADPIKRIARDLYAFSDEQLWGPSHNRNAADERYPRADGSYLAPRECLQRFGVEAGRECYPNTWIDLCIRTAQQLLTDRTGSTRYSEKQGLFAAVEPSRTRGVVVPDVRFTNEVAAIQAAGGVVIRVVRPGAGLDGSAGQHSSETEQVTIPDEKFDFVIKNSGTLEALREAVFRVLGRLCDTHGLGHAYPVACSCHPHLPVNILPHTR